MKAGGRPLPQIYLAQTRAAGRRVYQSEQDGQLHGSKIKWLVSTVLAAGVGAIAIGLVAYSTIDGDDRRGLLAMIEEAGSNVFEPPVALPTATVPLTFGKSDRLEATASGLVTKHVVREEVRQLVGDREAISFRPYARVIASLATAPPENADAIPPFNPLTLYANDRPLGAGERRGGPEAGQPVKAEVVELPGGVMPEEDGQELSEADVALILRTESKADEGKEEEEVASLAAPPVEATAAGLTTDTLNVASLQKNEFERDDAGKLDGQEVAVEQVKAGDTLNSILGEHGVAAWQARAIADAAKAVLKTDILIPGQMIRLTLVPSPTEQGQMEASSATLFSEGQGHLVTVIRNEAGDYAASSKAVAGRTLTVPKPLNQQQKATLYQSFYSTAISQGLSEEMIVGLLRTYAYDTDFKRRVGPGDSFEVFFDLVPSSKSPEGKPGEILFSSLTVGGETRRFYRYRTADGVTDFFDAEGSNAKKFLTRKPVRGDARFTSGFGMRLHPLLKQRRMHTGVDWSAPIGTAILAAGSGTIEEVGRKGGNGNFIRIRHANGYQTTYSHLSRFAPGLAPGLKVAQGQTIGHVGSTGLSSGPHLHFEVLINNSYVDPMTIHVPRERQLKTRELAEFQKERQRIDELMDLAPLTMGMIESAGNGG